jgi:hypothetical protein
MATTAVGVIRYDAENIVVGLLYPTEPWKFTVLHSFHDVNANYYRSPFKYSN